MKKEQRGFFALVVLSMSFFFLGVFFLPTAVWGQTHQTVKVGYYPADNFQETSADGAHHGFGYDYYMQVQKYTRWNYEFVEASYSECYQMLIDGQIDLMSGLAKTPERETQMIFSSYAANDSQNELYARSDEDDLFYESFDAFEGRKVAVMRGTLMDELDKYCRENGFTVQKVEYDSLSEMQEGLLNKEVDMLYASSVNANMDIKIVARMDKVPLYFVTTKSRPDLANELDSAFHRISDNNPNFYTEMADKYKLSGANAAATFTKEELEYINEQKDIYVIMNQNWAPISWYDSEHGTYEGIVTDVLENIKQYSDLNFIYCTEQEFNETAKDTPDIINHVIAILADDNAWADSQSVLMSNHIADASVVMVTKRGIHQSEIAEDSIIALPKDFYISWRMRDDFKKEQVVFYDTVEKCLDAINSGRADATFVNELVATYYLSMLEYSSLFATANSGYNENLAFAVNKDSEAPLLSILDKSLLCIGEDERDQIIIQNSIASQRVSLKGLYYSDPSAVIAVVIVGLLVCVAIGLLIYQTIAKRRRLARELEKETETINARTEFFMMISHELRTPLNAIVGYLNLASEQCEKNGWELEYIKRSKIAAKQLSDIAEDMLDYTRIASDTVTLQDGVFDLKDIIREVEQNISLAAIKKEIDFRFTVTNIDHEYVIGDKLRVAQMMQNLLANAVKFTAAGGKVEANISQTQKEDGVIELTFNAKDTGKGMSEEFLEKVCAPFNQGDKAYSRTHGGLGLGLYLTKYYLDAMGGTLQVESTLGKGSSFTFRIPLKRAGARELLDREIKFSHVRAAIAGMDTEENDKLKGTLKRLDIKCDSFTDTDKLAKRILSRSSSDYAYTMCVLDESMLDEDYSIIDKIAGYDHPPLIFVLSSDTKLIDNMSGNKNVHKVLYKPIFQSMLFDAVLDAFGQYKMDHDAVMAQNFEGVHALIVEDNMVNADILMRVLKKANVEAVICENGKIGYDEFTGSEPGTYQIIFMDIQMPVMNGYEATKAIRSSGHEQAQTIPILAVSANAFPEDIEQSMNAGMNEHMSKPISAARMYESIRKYVC
ncbi:MAG: transporter substrate-binding domain-containing protein [Clostridia bacterium]|nr:transporter substrate-binding domain-containing protein [Clostridia bacterium]NCC42827.1 transporter substrate-binding domain-containing protein [Clostridia bacterium]